MTNYKLQKAAVSGAKFELRPYPGRDIEQRTFKFAARILRLVRVLPKDVAGYCVARQLARAGTSVGANVEEAQGAQSRVEFARKMSIARSEAREARYWLRLLSETEMISNTRLIAITQEADELVRIITTITKKTRMIAK